jgi:polyhydroxyalkanoate synthase
MAWNADATRMPYKMHSEYLEKLFLNNDLSSGRFRVEGHSIAVENIEIPTFIVSTEKDHVAPWKSVYKLHLMLNSELTFVLTNGGHNAGILSEPGHPGRSYHITHRKTRSRFLSPDDWLKTAELHQEASWWTAWHNWLGEHSTGSISAKPLESKLPPAPGKYVFQK